MTGPIPSTGTRTVPVQRSRIASRWRNRIARLSGHLKNRRLAATRYDRLVCNYLAAVALSSNIAVYARGNKRPPARLAGGSDAAALP